MSCLSISALGCLICSPGSRISADVFERESQRNKFHLLLPESSRADIDRTTIPFRFGLTRTSIATNQNVLILTF